MEKEDKDSKKKAKEDKKADQSTKKASPAEQTETVTPLSTIDTEAIAHPSSEATKSFPIPDAPSAQEEAKTDAAVAAVAPIKDTKAEAPKAEAAPAVVETKPAAESKIQLSACEASGVDGVVCGKLSNQQLLFWIDGDFKGDEKIDDSI